MRTDLAERSAIVALLAEYGPQEPTMCAGWRTRELAAHLAARDRRIDAAPGVLIPAFSGWTERVLHGYAAKPWTELLELVRTGPPSWSPLRLRVPGELVNTAEFYVHFEDARRMQPEWSTRLDPARDAVLWKTLGQSARRLRRKAPCGLVLRRLDGEEIHARQGSPRVTVTGEIGELVVFAFGRKRYHLEFDGDPESIERLRKTDYSV